MIDVELTNKEMTNCVFKIRVRWNAVVVYLRFGGTSPLIFQATTPNMKGALRYKQAGHGFDSRWRHWNFSVT
jgi:hypothetical protein